MVISAFMQGTDMLLSDRSLRNTYLKKRRGDRTVMQRVTAENKDLLNPSETIEYFKLSRRKFYALIREKPDNDFIILYGNRRLIIRTAFEKYILKHPELRRCR